jgi:hypothetical protein
MARFVLDKNPEIHSDDSLSEIMKILEANPLNSIMFSNSFLKTVFLTKIIQASKNTIYYLDFDLLYSGYITSDIISKNKRVSLYQPTKNDFLDIFKNIIYLVSKKKSIVILDSLNGFFNLFNENQDAGRMINSYIILLSSISKMSGSFVLITSLARIKDNEGYVLSITGRHVLDSKNITKILTEKMNSNIVAKVLGETNKPKKIIKIPIILELI